MSAHPLLQVSRLSHAFGPREVLQDVSLQLQAGNTLALVGPSGSGKSTLLHLCGGLLAVREGTVQNGFARTAMLFQQPSLLPWKTVIDNIALGLKARGAAKAERTARARSMALAVGLDELALAQFPSQLSGGMQSRAALARALVLEPDLLLLDEPFSALDSQTRLALADEVVAILREEGKSVILVTHDLGEAITMTDRAIVLSKRPGRIRAEHTFTFASHPDPHPAPFVVRTLPEYNDYFTTLWRELEIHIGTPALGGAG